MHFQRELPYADDVAPLGPAIYNSLLSLVVFQSNPKNISLFVKEELNYALAII